MKEKILEALSSVDVENDDHWTADGAVRVDLVEELAEEGVTRADIVAAAPNFSRTNAVIEQDQPETIVEPELKPTPEFITPWANTEHVVRSMEEELSTSGEGLAKRIVELEKLEVQSAAALQVAHEEHDKLVGELKELREKVKAPALTLKQQLDLVHKQNAKEAEERLAKQEAIQAIAGGDTTLLRGILEGAK